MIRAGLLALVLLAAAPAGAVQPDEVLPDPALEARARALSQGLRCPVCRNESIDESHADVARDLRLVLRERLVAGDSDEEAIDFIVAAAITIPLGLTQGKEYAELEWPIDLAITIRV